MSLAVSILRDLLAGRAGVDAIALLSMSAALALGETLAAVTVAVMYAGGGVIEDLAVGRTERDLRASIDRAPRSAHRRVADAIEDIAIENVAVGDILLVRAGEGVPVDGRIIGPSALLDESAVTGEPLPVARRSGEAASSGTVNAGETFEMQAAAAPGDSTYAGVVGLVTTAQTAKSPFIRMADRYALLLLPVTLLAAGVAIVAEHGHIDEAEVAIGLGRRHLRGGERRRAGRAAEEGRRSGRGSGAAPYCGRVQKGKAVTVVAFDILKFAEKLEAGGFTHAQAKAAAEAFAEATSQELASKSDLRELELRMTVELGGLIVAATGVILAAIRYLPAGAGH